MILNLVEPVPVKLDSVEHVMCCQDNGLTLCGKRVAGTWAARAVACFTCAINERDDICPKHGKCP